MTHMTQVIFLNFFITRAKKSQRLSTRAQFRANSNTTTQYRCKHPTP